ncbi:acyl-CoA ligase (AMP-forming), exosortase A system-associated [Bowmanella sp. Y26]|uniref:acyl-CoA ligase (AMP-forming), exosortase A system-associated n=1 Tax=Bowmanella yangjiangensis TaxID=2811230 RepID=UPI001BDBBF8C|nr:acyl-CoA ligase (AMP-forming), exosortase A system-associated [Bowmanella yangjiangensis]MBT1064856.1 acyl-CoA ligase (AMP-forming), exosortase A system-associated [Bowmanella yangjiangensis]
MARFVHHLITHSAHVSPEKTALIFKQQHFTYQQLHHEMQRLASAFAGLNMKRHDRIAVYLPKSPEAVLSLFASSAAGGVFVPINHVLKAPQVQHILTDCDVSALITSSDRARALQDVLPHCPKLKHIILTDKEVELAVPQQVHLLAPLLETANETPVATITDNDMAAILYTSGSTGKPKGVVLSHRNILAGAESVSEYLGNDPDDVILALLPMSFDYGLNQITTTFLTGATCVLMDYLLPGDVVKTIEKHGVTGLAAVPPLWQQLIKAKWTVAAAASLRYFTNSGGAMPAPVLSELRSIFHNAQPYLMYGLTEAFRSTYLPPELVDERPGSMGKAIPNAEIMVVREDGSECAPDEPGELVHRGPHVSLGYWNAPDKTAERFKPVPKAVSGLMLTEMAVWSGDTVKKDKDGFLYFVGRRDEMIKTSGYRVSPMEVEDACYAASELIDEVVACGVADAELGQAIAVKIVLKKGCALTQEEVLKLIKKDTPNFMHPKYIELIDALPRNPNGKVDRSAISQELKLRYAQ